MIIKKVLVEKKNEDSGFVLKRIITSEGIFWARKMPVTNSLFNCELKRKQFKKSMLSSSFQTHHLHANKYTHEWMYDDLSSAKQHAKENNRIFLPYNQRKIDDLSMLKWHVAEADFIELVNKNVEFVPYVIPEPATLAECNNRFAEAEEILGAAQKIFPVLSANHDIVNFGSILKSLYGKYPIIGLHFMSPKTHANAQHNLVELWQENSKVEEGGNTSIVVGLCNQKHYGSTKVSGSFACARYAIDVPSQRQMHPDQLKGMMKSKEEQEEGEGEDVYIYDDNEGGFNKPEEQIAWYGENKVMKLLSRISLAENLEKYQAIMWSNFNGQKIDFEKLNEAILKKGAVKQLIESKSRWHIYLHEPVESV